MQIFARKGVSVFFSMSISKVGNGRCQVEEGAKVYFIRERCTNRAAKVSKAFLTYSSIFARGVGVLFTWNKRLCAQHRCSETLESLPPPESCLTDTHTRYLHCASGLDRCLLFPA